MTICCTPGINGDEDGGTDAEEEITTILTGTLGCEPEFDGALEFLLHFARGGGTAVLSKLAAACDATYIACKSIPQSVAPTAPLRRVSEIKGSSPDMTRAAAEIAPAEAIRLIAARAARGCLKIHDTCVSGRTFLSESDIKKASKKTERYASTAVSEIRAVGNVLKKRGQTAEIRRRIRRAERGGVDRVLEALALGIGILHIAQADTHGNDAARTKTKGANTDPNMRRSASVRIGRYTKKQAAAWGLW